MAKQSNPGALEGEQLISLAEPFGGWVIPLSSVSSVPHFKASIEGIEAPTFAKQTSNQYAESSGISLFQTEKLGHMGPGHGYSKIIDSVSGSPVINDLPLQGGVESNASLGVVLLKNGRIIQTDSAGANTINSYDPTNGSTRTAISSPNNDMVIFRDEGSTIVEWVVWSYDYGTGTMWAGSDIAIAYAKNLTTNTDNFYSMLSGAQTLSNTPHKICIGPDGNIYFTDRNLVRQIVVGAGTSLPSATVGNILNLGPGWTATGICAYKNYIAIIASNKVQNYAYGQTRVFLWDGNQTTTSQGAVLTVSNYIYDIPDNFGNGIYFDGNTLYVFTNGRNSSSKIFELTSKGFSRIFETPFIVTSTGLLQGSMDNFQDGIVMAALKPNETAQPAYGHLFRFYANGFHDDGYLSDGDNATADIAIQTGMCRNLFSNVLFVGVKYGTTYSIFSTNLSTYQCSTAGEVSNVELRSILYSSGILGRRMYPMGFKMTVTRIKLFLSQWGTGAALYLSAFNGYDTFLPGNTDSTNGGIDLLNILIDTNSAIPNGLISGTNPGGYTVGYLHYCYPAGTREIDLSNIGIIDVSSFYVNIRWKHTSPSSQAAIIRRCELHVAQSQ